MTIVLRMISRMCLTLTVLAAILALAFHEYPAAAGFTAATVYYISLHRLFWTYMPRVVRWSRKDMTMEILARMVEIQVMANLKPDDRVRAYQVWLSSVAKDVGLRMELQGDRRVAVFIDDEKRARQARRERIRRTLRAFRALRAQPRR